MVFMVLSVMWLSADGLSCHSRSRQSVGALSLCSVHPAYNSLLSTTPPEATAWGLVDSKPSSLHTVMVVHMNCVAYFCRFAAPLGTMKRRLLPLKKNKSCAVDIIFLVWNISQTSWQRHNDARASMGLKAVWLYDSEWSHGNDDKKLQCGDSSVACFLLSLIPCLVLTVMSMLIWQNSLAS